MQKPVRCQRVQPQNQHYFPAESAIVVAIGSKKKTHRYIDVVHAVGSLTQEGTSEEPPSSEVWTMAGLDGLNRKMEVIGACMGLA